MTELEVRRNPRARTIRLVVDPLSGRARLTLPPRASLKRALAWAEERRDWIDAQRARLPREVPFAPGSSIPFADGSLLLLHRADAARRPVREGDTLICGGPAERFAARVERWLRGEALHVLSAESNEFADRAGVTIEGVAIGDPRGRWGSCSAAGAIRYSWRLILMPAWVRRAIVAHEIAHRLHMNHSPAFHSAVEALAGDDARRSRAWLRAHGTALHWIGRGS